MSLAHRPVMKIPSTLSAILKLCFNLHSCDSWAMNAGPFIRILDILSRKFLMQLFANKAKPLHNTPPHSSRAYLISCLQCIDFQVLVNTEGFSIEPPTNWFNEVLVRCHAVSETCYLLTSNWDVKAKWQGYSGTLPWRPSFRVKCVVSPESQ